MLDPPPLGTAASDGADEGVPETGVEPSEDAPAGWEGESCMGPFETRFPLKRSGEGAGKPSCLDSRKGHASSGGGGWLQVALKIR